MATGRKMFFNRELSWLRFNQRVLDEACNTHVPLLDRLNFLAITASNLDEFFMVRVGQLTLLAADGITKTDPAGHTPADQLALIAGRVRRMVEDQYACYRGALLPSLAREGIRRVAAGDLDEMQFDVLRQFFEKTVFPVVTPMAVRDDQPFPLLVNLGLNIAVRLRPGQRGNKPLFAVIPAGASLDRFVQVPVESGYAYVLLEDVITLFIHRLFPGETVAEAAPFRLTRNADLSIEEDLATDFLAEMQSLLSRRRLGECVRLELAGHASRTLTYFLRRSLRIAERSVYRIDGPLDLSAFRKLASLQGFESLRHASWPPQPNPAIDLRRSIFDELSQRSVLLAHPYESFDPVVRLVEEASADPNVMAIKQILYRTSPDSPIVAALRRAAERGKYVTVIVELKARFDEAQNIGWARQLEEAGVQVIYGVKGFKTHAKLCIVVRREPGGVVRYLHFGTGNYNDRTARNYSDIGYMTRDEDLATDASAFFNAITGYSVPHQFLKLEAAPTGLRRKLQELIEGEAQRQKHGQRGLIMAKMNSLVDPQLIRLLYRASRAGVKILLNVRGICCLRPGLKNLSENISVVSIVDRLLEHSRIFYFHQGGEPRVFISSADWMPRNLDRRIELMVPVEDATCRRKLVGILRTCFADNVKSSRLCPDGSYQPAETAGRRRLRSQEALYQQACAAIREARRVKRTVFEPHRPGGDRMNA